MRAELEKRGILKEYILGGSTVWLLYLRELTEKDFVKLYACLSAERRKKADGIRAEGKRKQSIGGGYLLYLLKKQFSIEEEPVIMPGGKPAFSPERGIWFNISHSGAAAALAFGEKVLGLDIEYGKRADLKVAKRFFRQEEYDYLAGLEEGAREDAFCRIWTGKEAVLKAAGRGLSVPLNSFSVLGETKKEAAKEGDFLEISVCLAGDRYGLCQQKLTENGYFLWASVAFLHE